MKGRLTLYLVAAALLAGCQSKPAPEAPHADNVATTSAPDIAGVKLGATEAEFKAAYPKAICHFVDVQTRCQASPISYAGSESGAITVVIVDGVTKMVLVDALDHDKFDAMASALVTKAGAPTRPSAVAEQPHADLMEWETSDWYLSAERSDKEGQGSPTVTLVNQAWLHSKPAAETAPDIKGVMLGATQGEVMALFPSAKCQPEKDGDRIGCVVSPVSFGGTERAGLIIIFANDKANRIGVTALLPEKFDYLASLMVTRFGPPSDDKRLKAHGSSDSLVWFGDGWVMVANRKDDERYSGVHLVSQAYVDSENNREVEKAAREL